MIANVIAKVETLVDGVDEDDIKKRTKRIIEGALEKVMHGWSYVHSVKVVNVRKEE